MRHVMEYSALKKAFDHALGSPFNNLHVVNIVVQNKIATTIRLSACTGISHVPRTLCKRTYCCYLCFNGL